MDRRTWLYSILLLLVLVLLLFALLRFRGIPLPFARTIPTPAVTPAISPAVSVGPEPNWGVQTKKTGCQANGPLQDLACTPGDIFRNISKAEVCTPGYATSVRDVTQSVKNRAYSSYGITRRLPGQYEVDHLVPLQLGGSNAIANLWPEAGEPRPGYREKNRVENYLHDQVCSGALSLKDAQIEIATNWLAVYTRLPQNAVNESNDDQP